jgi:hypothetical protein
MSRIFKPDSGQTLEIQDEGGSAALTIDTDGNVEIANDIEQVTGKQIHTSEIRAKDGDGLKLYEDGGSGIFVEDSTGYVGIGTDSPGGLLSAQGSIATTQIDSNGVAISFNRQDWNYIQTTTTSSRLKIVAQTGGVELANGATSWAASSDERFKEIIEPITGAISKIEQIRPLIGRYKTDEEGTRRSFVIAQDVEKVFPEVVYTSTEDTTEKKEYLSLAYTELIPLLIAGIQELSVKVTALENA